jgi:GTP-binding protein Era
VSERDVPLREDFRCGYVAIIGEPNVGKSTLMNALLQQKISIVTNKPQTTRHKVLGILSTSFYQIVFLDTPGIIKPKYRLQEVMMQAAYAAMADADVLFFMIDAARTGTDRNNAHDEIFDLLKGLHKPVFLIINKVDLVQKSSLLPIIAFFSRAFAFKEIFPISALTKEGTDKLLEATALGLPCHPPYYPPDIVSEHSERFFVGEIIREKIFIKTHQEIPYSTTVDIVEFKEREKGKWFISADVYVERDSQKGILIGRGGEMLRSIGEDARKEIEGFLQHPVFLELHLKVRRNWRGDEQWLARLGYKA